MGSLQKALAHLNNQEMEAAMNAFISYTEESPEDPVGYINIGNMLMQTHQYEEAERFFLKAIEKDERAATAYYGLGSLHYTAKIYDNAELMFNKTLDLGLRDSDVFFMIGMTHVKREQDLLSLPFLQRATELAQEDAETIFQYGLGLAKTGYLEEAEHQLLDVLKLDKSHADARYNLALIKAKRHDPKKALDLLQQVLSDKPGHELAKQAKESIEHNTDTP